MSKLDGLVRCAGSWRGTSKLQDSENNLCDESPSTATVTPVCGGRFVRIDYTWNYKGKPQEGSLLVGFDGQADEVTCHWIDSWHMGDRVMACRGPRPAGSLLNLRGSYAAPPGPDWGWRIELNPTEAGSLRVVMFNIWPEGGREELAVEAIYTRV